MRYINLLALSLFALAPTPAYSEQTMDAVPSRICSMEAKACPDGSYVSRTGPHCEFSPCPGETGAPHATQPDKGNQDKGDEEDSAVSGTGIAQPGDASPCMPPETPHDPPLK